MNGMEMTYGYELFIHGEKKSCPDWVAAEKFYNCENFSAMLARSGFSLERLFHRSEGLDLSRI